MSGRSSEMSRNATKELIRDLEFYNQSYVKSCAQSLGFAMSRIAFEVPRVSKSFAHAIACLEDIATKCDKRLEELKATAAAPSRPAARPRTKKEGK